MKKGIVTVVALLLAVCILSTVSLAARQVPKPKQIVAFLDDTMLTPARGQEQFVDEYKKLTGIDLKIIQPVHNQYYEKLRLAFAAGDIPDVIEIAEHTFVQYANEGAFVD
ncbi:MAG TPA: extracellular solute-binding protein, partial [Bacillota bacterium]|nr:extracellular solute-binding protein [Bacillota bacterium]